MWDRQASYKYKDHYTFNTEIDAKLVSFDKAQNDSK